MANDYEPLEFDENEKRAIEDELEKDLALSQDNKDLLFLLDKRAGRRFIWGILERGKVLAPTFNSDAMAMAFSEGRKTEAGSLMSQILVLAPGKYTQMMNEAVENE